MTLARRLLFLLAPTWFYAGIKIGLVSQLISNPTAAFSYAGILVLYLCSSPSKTEICIITGVTATTWIVGRPPLPNDFPLSAPVHILAIAGFIGVGALIVRSALAAAYRPALEMLVKILIFVVLGIAIGQILDLASRLRPLKFDTKLYIVELSMGSPSFAIGKWFSAFPQLASFELLIYYSLPLALAAAYAAHLRAGPNRVDFLLLLYINAIVGFSMYILFPACGPAYVFKGSFPWVTPPLVTQAPLALSCRPNAMPSLHVSGAFLVLWNSRAFWPVRTIAFFYLGFTVLATLGFGEHYMIDLIVALPFALFVQAMGTDSHHSLRVALGAMGGVLVWLALLYYIPETIAHPAAFFPLAVASLALVRVGCQRLKQSPDLNMGSRHLETGPLEA